MNYAKEKGVEKDEILFLGDDFKKGGNDEQIKLGGVDYIAVTDYRSLGELLTEKGIID